MSKNNLSRSERGHFLNKGQAELVSHAILVGFSMFLIFVIITTFTNVKKDYQTFVGEKKKVPPPNETNSTTMYWGERNPPPRAKKKKKKTPRALFFPPPRQTSGNL